DAIGAFAGGAILPGFGLMARALHSGTALLPLIEAPSEPPPLPGTSTPAAISAGVFWSVVGALRSILGEYQRQSAVALEVYLTGGDGARLAPLLPGAKYEPFLTLEGIRLAAHNIPD